MGRHDTRLWALFIAIAFAVLWCVSVGVTTAVPAEEPLEELTQAVTAPEIEMIGVVGWCLVGVGFLGVGLVVGISGRPRRKKRLVRAAGSPRRPRRVSRSVYSRPPARRFGHNVERRY